MITIDEFNQVEMHIGTIINVQPNKKSRHPAYVITVDLGPEYGIKKSSAQITDLYQPDDLIEKQIVCCTNLTPIHIGSVKSEIRILGVDTKQGCVLLLPAKTVPNGSKIF